MLTIKVVYWAILYASFGTTFDRWSNISQHALNCVFAVFEVVFAATSPMPWIHLLWLVILLALYLAVAFITYGTDHFYVYSFLDDRTHGRKRVAAYVFAILAACIVVFVVVWLLIWVRKRLTERQGSSKTIQYSVHEKERLESIKVASV